MAEPQAEAAPGASKPPKPPNPVWKMMGLPNFRFRLPSRNWMIFLSITGSWTAAVMYDRREKKRIQKKWTRVVEHIALERLDTQQLPRKLTVFISAPPGDGLMPARDHFNEYVKPILVAAALDWDAVEGRREGDVRAGLAERIRKLRKHLGEATTEPVEGGTEELLDALRERSGVKTWPGHGGDIVVGRHAWKEYVRGLHEGWLGPVDDPNAETVQVQGNKPILEDPPSPSPASSSPPEEGTVVHQSDAGPPITPAEPTKAEEPDIGKQEEEKKPKKKTQPPPFILPGEYDHAILSRNCPQALGPSTTVPLPNLLGFFNFPIRMYRFLHRRKVADDAGRQTAAAALGVYRPFDTMQDQSSDSAQNAEGQARWEQERLLEHEEPDWHKTARDRSKDEEGKERVWLDNMVLDSRIAERMRAFALDRDVEERAKNLPMEREVSWLDSLWPQPKARQAWEGLSDD